MNHTITTHRLTRFDRLNFLIFTLLLIGAATASATSSAAAFLVKNTAAQRAIIKDMADAQTDCQLRIQLDISGNPTQSTQSEFGPTRYPKKNGKIHDFVYESSNPKQHRKVPLFLDGLEVTLRQHDPVYDTRTSRNNKSVLPPSASLHGEPGTGARPLDILRKASFVTIAGTVFVDMEDAAWELVWRDQSQTGNLVLGFEVSKAAVRNENGAELPKGRVYLSFPMWTVEGLIEQQATKLAVEAKAAEYQAEKMACLKKVQDASSMLEKALRYRDALEMTEKQSMTGAHMFRSVPSTMDEVVPLQTPPEWTLDSTRAHPSGVLVGKSGIIWRSGSQKPGLVGSASRPIILGECHLQRMIVSPTNEDLPSVPASGVVSDEFSMRP